MASSWRRTLRWLVSVEAGLCVLPVATVIDHLQLLTDEVGGVAMSNRWRDSGTLPGHRSF